MILTFAPLLYLLFIFGLVNIIEWFEIFIEKKTHLVHALYDIIIHIMSNPIIVTVLVFYFYFNLSFFEIFLPDLGLYQ